jgi:hypothetical protein
MLASVEFATLHSPLAHMLVEQLQYLATLMPGVVQLSAARFQEAPMQSPEPK